MYGIKPDICSFEIPTRFYTLEDYESNIPRWCPGCGDHTVLTSVQRLCKEKQLKPEKTVFVSGIGCSSRFPHYMKTYGFHGLHGRALPVACGIKFRRPDLNVFVITGDGDCCSIGTGHWIHAIRYNMNMTVLMFDNEIYGLTKKQTSPTSKQGLSTNTHPKGAVLKPINPTLTTLSVINVSFVAQTVDWAPTHLYATIKKAFEHEGFSFVRIIQRCPHFLRGLFDPLISDPNKIVLLEHENGIEIDDSIKKTFKNTISHNPLDIHKARDYASDTENPHIGLLYQNTSIERYDLYGASNIGISVDEKIENINKALDKYAV